MGRKPKALISEFFDRGPKLTDQSNRYQHTCKRCGEVFPKGRPDSLQRHIFSKCPAITDADRTRAFYAPPEKTTQNTASLFSSSPLGMDMPSYTHQREPSGLDTLAEVSRQMQESGEAGSDEAFIFQLQQSMENDDASQYSTGNHAYPHPGASLTPSTTPPAHLHQFFQSQSHNENQNVQHHADDNHAHHHSHGDQLHSHSHDDNVQHHGHDDHVHHHPHDDHVQHHPHEDHVHHHTHDEQVHHQPHNDHAHHQPINDHVHHSFPEPSQDNVSSTNEQLAEAAMQQSQSNGSNPRKRKASIAPDPALPNSYLSYYPERPLPAVDPQLQQSQQRPVESLPKNDHNIQFTPGEGGFGLLQRSSKNKARGRFSEERRKEVQSIRKKGACIRCRMLKKPCSEGTPCGTCSNIETARLWKGACLRTRVADEFRLYSTTYFYRKDHDKVFASLNGNEPQSVHGRIEATLFPASPIFATFPALKTNRAGRPADHLDPHLVNHAQEAEIYLLNFKITEDTLALKLERYLENAVMQCIAAETSPVIKATLELAAEWSATHEDPMLTKFIHLWVATNLLVSKEKLWSLSYNQRDAPVTDHMDGTDGLVNDSGPADSQRFSLDSEDYDIMNTQLQDAAERYCTKQVKVCLNELERRLLQRQHPFLTFLSAVIMLNCVERMTALYCSFDPQADTTFAMLHAEDSTTPESIDTHARNNDPAGLPASVPARSDHFLNWPPLEPAARLWPQGIKFAQLLQLLLRMRGLPPTVQIKDDGTLAIVSSFNKAYPPVSVATNVDGTDSQQLLAAEWIDRAGLTASTLWRVHNMSELDLQRNAWGTGVGEGQGAKAWDLKFLAALLLPQRA